MVTLMKPSVPQGVPPVSASSSLEFLQGILNPGIPAQECNPETLEVNGVWGLGCPTRSYSEAGKSCIIWNCRDTVFPEVQGI